MKKTENYALINDFSETINNTRELMYLPKAPSTIDSKTQISTESLEEMLLNYR